MLLLLTRFRRQLSRTIRPIGLFLVKAGVNPDHLTLAAIGLGLVYIYSTYIRNYYLALILLLASGFLDVLDGEVARLKNASKPSGALLDSTIDRLLDGLYVLGLVFLGLDYVTGFLLLIFSYGVSYVRARAEALNVSLEGIGFVERGERILGFSLIIVFLSIDVFLGFLCTLLLLILTIVTFALRVAHAYNMLRFKKF